VSNAKREEKKYYQKLGVVPLSIDNIKKIIKTNIKNTLQCWKEGKNIDRQTFKVIGSAGIGKTEISIQLAKELSEELKVPFQHIIIKAPVLSRDDLLCPFPIVDNGRSRFKMLYSDFVPLDSESYGIFIIDELSRGDSSFQQLCWQIQNEQKVHTLPLPKHWWVVCLDNPDDQEYSLNTVEDAAGLRRTLHLYSEVNAQAFLNYAISNNFHPLVVEYIQIHPDLLYDFDAQKVGMIFANPASWERVSNILWGYDKEDGILKNLDSLTTLFGGLLNQSSTRLFINYIRDRKDISPRDVFSCYEKVRDDILKFIKDGENVRVVQLLESFITFLLTSRPKYGSDELKNISTFLLDLPSDIGVLFITKLVGYDQKSPEYMYITGIHVKLVEMNPKYKEEFYETLVQKSEKANQND
jgi:hypothetical protein